MKGNKRKRMWKSKVYNFLDRFFTVENIFYGGLFIVTVAWSVLFVMGFRF